MMGVRHLTLAGVRLAMAVLVAIAVGYQLSSRVGQAEFSVVNFFSFFTILSNLFAAVTWGVVAAHAGRPRPGWLEWLRGAAVVYMATTGVVFALLLSDLSEELQVTVPWVDTVLHRVMPVVVVLDWLLDPPRRRIRWTAAGGWLVAPIIWLDYTLLRGPLVGWYPYPFLDPRPDGYAEVALTCGAVAIGMVLLAAAVAWVGNRLGARWPASFPS